MTTRLLADLLRAAQTRGYITAADYPPSDTERYIGGVRWGVGCGDRREDGSIKVIDLWNGPDQYSKAVEKLAKIRKAWPMLNMHLVYSIEGDPEYWHIVPRDQEPLA